MQKLDKSVVKSKLAYTWYLYPIAIAAATIIWTVSFKALHQPNFHETVTLFVGASVKDYSFTSNIQKRFESQNLRQVDAPNCASSSSIYASKLNLFLSSSDLLILEQSTVDTFASKEEGSAEFLKEYFVPFSETIKEKYIKSGSTYFTFNDTKTSQNIDYGVLVNAKESTSYLSSYVTFLTDQNYYLFMSTTSKNLGDVLDSSNKGFTNALDTMKYISYGGTI